LKSPKKMGGEPFWQRGRKILGKGKSLEERGKNAYFLLTRGKRCWTGRSTPVLGLKKKGKRGRSDKIVEN